MLAPDRIEQSLVLQAPVERVFAAIATPDEFVRWFCERVEGGFEVGEQPVLDEGEYGRFRIAIVERTPPKRFAFRWVSGSHIVPQGFEGDPLQHPNTLVAFELEPEGAATRLRLVESGFSSLPEEYAATNHADNVGGWELQLERLRLWLAGA